MRIRFENLWSDYDGMFELSLGIGNQKHWLVHESYVYMDKVLQFAEELINFPISLTQQIRFLKDFDANDRFIGMICLMIAMHTAGMARIEVKARESDSECILDNFESNFCVTCEPSFLNRLGVALRSWCHDMSQPLEMRDAKG